MRTIMTLAIAVGLGCLVSAAGTRAADELPRPKFQDDGTVMVPAFQLPVSAFMSEPAKALQRARAKGAGVPAAGMPTDIAAARKAMDAMNTSSLQAARAMFAVTVEETTVAGVPVRVVTPKDGKVDPQRVLLNLHGGAFAYCWDSCSFLESAPIAALGGYKVVTVNYRMAPEHKHPAAMEDATKVYAELLKHYAPKHIGIFGCSAGGALTAQLAAWLPAHGLPQAGAAGIFGSGAIRSRAGDSAYVSFFTDAQLPPPGLDGTPPPDITFGYFDTVGMTAPDVSPGLYPEVLKKYPPTLIITGTRAFDMSPAIYTNSLLIKAGVETQMIVGEGMDHCYILNPALPESQDADAAIVGFFKRHLK